MSPRPAPSVWIVVPTWNGREQVCACLPTIARQTYAGPLHTVVVDNGSSDGTADAIAAGWPGVEVVSFPEQLGFSRACNTGVTRALEAGADYVCLVNDDTLLDPALIERLVEAAEARPDAALLNPLICYADRPATVWACGNRLSLWSGVGGGCHPGESAAAVEAGGVRAVDAATGCILLARASAVRAVGLLPDGFFAYYEDADWSLRMTRAGFAILAVPAARALHKVSADTQTNVDQPAWTYYYNVRNRLALMRRHGRAWHWAVFAPRFGAWVAWKVAGLTVLGRRSKRNAIVDGVRDFILGRFPATPYVPRP